ncbi:BlaI/MecI/CopY family transcriptional regulator [Paraglaciecola sp.]|jgi:predicted transcriptional regulator|uniref:BlaI/MecI/CopY family transcriptional regulator n=1 Tax=Paraglaciecola sp. TaxID=1920173 RepID=UPI0030F45C8C
MQLGELEKIVLQYIWSVPEADAKQVHSVLEKERANSVNTIQSTLDRLHKKGLLDRTKQGHAFQYRAKVGRDELIAKLIDVATCDFMGANEHSLIAAFSSASAKMNEAQLDLLEKMIEQQRLLRKSDNQ